MSTPDTAKFSKADVLQVLLDTQQMCLDLFDAVDQDTLRIDRDLLLKLGRLVTRLGAYRVGFVQEYLLSGRAGDDVLADIRASFKRPGAEGSHGS